MTGLIALAEKEGIRFYELELPKGLKGLYYDYTIVLNKGIETEYERKCVFAEELGHFYTSIGNILDMNIESNRKQEQRARAWAFEKLAPFNKIVEAYDNGYTETYETAEYLEVTEDFIKEAIIYYQNKYGRK